MIWFWMIAGLLIVLGLVVLLRPLIGRTGRDEGGREAEVAMFRRQLADLETERQNSVLELTSRREILVDLDPRLGARCVLCVDARER